MSSSSKSKRPRSTSRSLKDEVSRGGRKSSRSSKRHRRSSKKRKHEDQSEDESGAHEYGNMMPASGFTDYDPSARRDSSSRRSGSGGRSSSPKNWWEHRPPYVKRLSRRSPGRGESRRMDEFARSSMPRGRGARGHHMPRGIPMMYHHQESGGGPMLGQMMHPGMMPFPVGGHEGGPGHWRPSDSAGFYMPPNLDPHMVHFGNGRGAPSGFSMAPGQMHRHYGPNQGDSRFSSGGSRSSSYDSKSSRSSKGGSSRTDKKRRKERSSRGHRSRRKIENSFNSAPGGPPAGFRGPRANGQPVFARKEEAPSWTERSGAHQNKSLQSTTKKVDAPGLPGRLRFIPPEPFDESEEHELLQAVEAEVNGDEERGCVPAVFHLVPPHLAGPSLYSKLKEFV